MTFPSLRRLACVLLAVAACGGKALAQSWPAKPIRLVVNFAPRSPQLPNVATLAESGLTGFDADSLFGIYAPAGTPAAVLARVHEEVNKALQQPTVSDAIKALGAEPAAMSREDFLDRHAKERDLFEGLVKELGLKLE